MECNVNRQPVTINEVIFDALVEHPVECDVLLPDYCPDVVKILKCSAVCKVLSYYTAEETLNIDAAVAVDIFYLSEDRCIKHTEYKLPFSKAVDLKTAVHNPVITVHPTINYLNCRATSQRRIDIRGAVGLTIKVINQRPEEIVCGCDGVQLKKDLVPHTMLVGQAVKQLSVREDLELASSKPVVVSILKVEAFAKVTDHKMIAGKVIVKGEANLRVLYEGDDEAKVPQMMEYALPISQIVDIAGVDDTCSCYPTFDVCQAVMEPKDNMDGEFRMFSCDLLINCAVTAHRENSITLVSDCYCTKCESSFSAKPVSLLRLIDMVNCPVMIKETLDLPEAVSAIYDIWCTVSNCHVKGEGNVVEVSGKLMICMFAQTEEHTYFEKEIDFAEKITLREACDAPIFMPDITIQSTSFSLIGQDKIEVRCDMSICGCVYCPIRLSVLTDIQLDESRPISTNRHKGLILYHADPGESLWEIAKRYNTSIDLIMQENALDNDILGDKAMLLIPVVSR